MGKGKITFEVQDNETIDDCLVRMKKEGYAPIRRIEKPIFREAINDGQKTYEPAGRQIIFEGVEMQ